MGTRRSGTPVSRIAFCSVPEEGHFYAAFGLARTLAARGHRTAFFAVPDYEPLVAAHGFEFHPILEHVRPKGSTPLSTTAGKRGPGVRDSALARLREDGQRLKETYDYWQNDGLRPVVEEFAPELALVDHQLGGAALAFYRYRIPVVLLSTTLPRTDDDPAIPPLDTALLPARTRWERWVVRRAWQRRRWSARLGRKLASLAGVDLDVLRLMRRLARAVGYPVDQIDAGALFRPALNFPELVLCPEVFDFPRPRRPGRVYVEAGIDSGRTAPSFPRERLDPGKPLILCALGSQCHRYHYSRRVLRAVAGALAGLTGYQAVIATGRDLDPREFEGSPNVLAVNWMPQTELLQKAVLMISHGGLASVKECVYFGVPVIVFPLTRDQPGNGARVVYHGLGAMAAPRSATPEGVRALIRRVLAPPYPQRVRAMSEAFRRVEESDLAVRTIENLMSDYRPPGVLSTRRYDGLENSRG